MNMVNHMEKVDTNGIKEDTMKVCSRRDLEKVKEFGLIKMEPNMRVLLNKIAKMVTEWNLIKQVRNSLDNFCRAPVKKES